MPRLTRRVAARAAFATGGTVVAALLARKWPTADRAQPTGPSPALLDPASLRAVVPPAALPDYRWQENDAAGHGRVRSLADYAGRAVVLNIWATWCDPCRREMPSLARLAATLAPSGIAVLPVSIDHAGAAPIEAFYSRHAIAGLPILTDPDAGAMTALGIGAIPVTLLIGPEGRLRGRLDGGADWSVPSAAALVRRLTGS